MPSEVGATLLGPAVSGGLLRMAQTNFRFDKFKLDDDLSPRIGQALDFMS
jgi:predicted lipoprotein